MSSFREAIDRSSPPEASRFDPTEVMSNEDELSGLPGAWGLEFGQPTQTEPSDTVEFENVIPPENRRPVMNTEQGPWNRICCLLLRYQSGARAVGTGWLAGPRTVLTAGHCVFQHRFGWAKSVQVIPGWNGGPPESAPFGAHLSTRCLSVRAWVERREGAYDCGAVILPETSVFSAPFIPFIAAPDSILQGREVAIAGYPTDRAAGTMWIDAQPLSSVNARFLFYNVDTEDGQSGAPALVLSENGPVAVGLHTDGSNQGNFGLRITDELVQIFRGWLNL